MKVIPKQEGTWKTEVLTGKKMCLIHMLTQISLIYSNIGKYYSGIQVLHGNKVI